ncbi:hypothetical protein [Elstera litoralis]|uniref:hypothetical protein n=1 Tax=Elstera litoralis TaxID=552518 RepID=UPI001E44A613|nr:hypothetical protein [Elstera litoralis]
MPYGERQGQQQFNRAALALVRPKPHRQGRNEEEVQPRQEIEKSLKIGLPALEEIPHVEG